MSFSIIIEMMKKYLSLFVLIVLGLTNVHAQTLHQEVYPQQSSIEHNQAVRTFSQRYVSGIGMQSTLSRELASLSGAQNHTELTILGSENSTWIIQSGSGLLAQLSITGDANQAKLSQQGTDLQAQIDIVGNANLFDLLQDGIGLQHSLQLLGDGLQYQAIQTNQGLELTQFGVGTMPLQIEHQGGVLPIRIEHY
jgi:hypothetical protein